MGLDGSGVECLTCNKYILQLHNGNPEWHPSGEYIVFQAQDPDLEGLPPGFFMNPISKGDIDSTTLIRKMKDKVKS